MSEHFVERGSAGSDFWQHLRSCMRDVLGFMSCPADPDVWMRESTREDGTPYWEYVLLYTDDCLVISDRAEAVLRKEIWEHWDLKEDSIAPPEDLPWGSDEAGRIGGRDPCVDIQIVTVCSVRGGERQRTLEKERGEVVGAGANSPG